MITSGLFTSETDDWATPPEIFDPLNEEFGFTLDVCASPHNTKLPKFYSMADDGLNQPWNGVCWMNPPYGRTIKEWMAKAVKEWRGGATIICLVPARTDTAWWHDYAMLGEIRFLRGRVKFINPIKGDKNAAPFPSAIVIFRGRNA